MNLINNKKRLLIIDGVMIAMIFLSSIFFPLDYTEIAIYLFLIFYIIFTRRKILFYYLLTSSGIAIIWLLIAKNEYGYSQYPMTILNLDVIPLFGWAIGLFLLYLIYLQFEYFLKNKSFLRRILVFVAIAWTMLIIVETIAYHILNIHNIPTATYPGLPLCDCIHVPHWMQVSYFTIPVIYFSVCYLIRLANKDIKRGNS